MVFYIQASSYHFPSFCIGIDKIKQMFYYKGAQFIGLSWLLVQWIINQGLKIFKYTYLSMLDRAQLSVSPILSNFSSFVQLSKLAEQLDPYEFSEIILDMQQMTWCDGNMCSPLGALLY